MFELNKVQRTKDGELLKPFAVQGTMVLCADKNGNTIKRPLSDFDFSIPKETEVISVQPIKNNKQEIIEVDEGKNDDGLFIEDVQDEEVFTPEPEEPEKEPEPTKPGSIWDELGDDDYL